MSADNSHNGHGSRPLSRRRHTMLSNPFYHDHNHKESRSRSSTVSTVSDSISSGEDRSSITKSVFATTPVCFPFASANILKHRNGKNDYITDFPFNDDEDYKKFLKEPKYIKTFKKSLSSAAICKRLFLAQELNQNDENGQTTGSNDLRKDISNTNLKNIEDLRIGPNDFISNDSRSPTSSPLPKPAKASVWAMKFNNDGKYLATAGKSNIIKVWKVLFSPLDRLKNDTKNKTLYASVFQPIPIRSYNGHTHDILSIDWSKNDFLLSSSMDKTVKLWNIKKDECLRTFQHREFVTSVKFHPTDDRFFISGCLDHKVRLWSILESDVSCEFDAENLVTAVGFTPNGNLVIVGTFSGEVYFLDTQNLELRHSIKLNKKRSSTGARITGIETFVDKDDIKVLITSNDSKIRLLSLRHRQLEVYFKGSENTSSQITASLSDDKKYIISGSENHYVYLWSLEANKDSHHDSSKKITFDKKKRGDSTSFQAHNSRVTCALLAPIGTQRTLSLSNDFIYELNSEFGREVKDKNGGLKTSATLQSEESLFQKSKVGSIIVTADDTGLIRVFRQDIDAKARKYLIENNKSSNKNSKEGSTSPYLKPTSSHRIFSNKNANSSAHSLISRRHSFRKATGVSDTETSDMDTPTRRSRRATIDSKITTSLSDDQERVRCEVCHNDIFIVKTATPGTRNDIIVVCKDCANQINTSPSLH